MNCIQKSNIKLSLCRNRSIFIKIISKSKYRRMSQPGLFRYNMSGQDVGYYDYDSSLTHGSNAEILISRVPVVEVDDNIALCYVRNFM